MSARKVQFPVFTEFGNNLQSSLEGYGLFTKNNGCGEGSHMKFLYTLACFGQVLASLYYIYMAVTKKSVKGKILALFHIMGRSLIGLYALHAIKNCRTLESIFWQIIYGLIFETFFSYMKKKLMNDAAKKVVAKTKEQTKAVKKVSDGASSTVSDVKSKVDQVKMEKKVEQAEKEISEAVDEIDDLKNE